MTSPSWCGPKCRVRSGAGGLRSPACRWYWSGPADDDGVHEGGERCPCCWAECGEFLLGRAVRLPPVHRSDAVPGTDFLPRHPLAGRRPAGACQGCQVAVLTGLLVCGVQILIIALQHGGVGAGGEHGADRCRAAGRAGRDLWSSGMRGCHGRLPARYQVMSGIGVPACPRQTRCLSQRPYRCSASQERGCQMIVSIWHPTPVLRANFSSHVTSVALSLSARAT